MAAKPRPAATAYMESARAAPRPTASPKKIPWVMVVLMHIMPMGPTGAAIARPMSVDCKNKISIFIGLHFR